MERLSLSVQTVSVVLVGPTGQETEAEICEMTAEARDRYLDLLAARMKIDASGQVAGVKRYEGLQAELLSRCLRRKDTGAYIPITEIQSWPSSVVTALFQKAQDLNHLGKEPMTAAEKNE